MDGNHTYNVFKTVGCFTLVQQNLQYLASGRFFN